MATKIFCDCCGREFDKNLQNLGNVRVEILRKDPGPAIEAVTRPNGDVCKYCIIDAIVNLDDRERVPPLAAGEIARSEFRFHPYVVLPRLATVEMVSSVRTGPGGVTSQWLQDAWRQMYDAACPGSTIPTYAAAEAKLPAEWEADGTHMVVPIEPTAAMLHAGEAELHDIGGWSPRSIWKAMLDAAKRS